LFLKEWAIRHGKELENLSNEELIAQEDVINRIQQEIDSFNVGFGNWEQIKKFVLLPKELSIDREELTPTLKLKRKNILKRYHQEYRQIYSD
jgi:long-chain acyl-CoA synthetase